MEPNANEDSSTNWYNLRSDRGRSYGHPPDHQMDVPVSSKSYESGLQMDVSKVAPTPAKKNLFTVDNGSEQHDKQQGELFHSIVAKLLTFPIELEPMLNWLLRSSAPESLAARSRIGKS